VGEDEIEAAAAIADVVLVDRDGPAALDPARVALILEDTAAGMADLPTTRLRWLGSVRDPCSNQGPRPIPGHATSPMARSQHLAT
jgi:hypothetical protein